MTRFYSILPALLIAFIPFQLKAQKHHVPAEYSTIQEAIDQSAPNDTILVHNGVFTENIIIDKPLVITSLYLQTNNQSDIVNTIIDGDSSGSVATISDITTGDVKFIGMTVRNGTGTLHEVDVEGEDAGAAYLHGGGLFILDGGAVYLENMIITENHILSEHNNAGGVFCQNTDLYINNSIITKNTIRGISFLGRGAGLFVVDCNTEINSSEITYNSATSGAYGHGGGIYARNGSLKIDNTVINNNESINEGGLSTLDTDLELTDSEISDNYAMITGAIRCANIYSATATSKIENCVITNNFADNTAGTIVFAGNTAEIRNCQINDNEGGLDGGAIAADNTTISIYDCEIMRNTVSSGIGGNAAGTSFYKSYVYINNTVISENECLPDNSFNQGGGILSYESVIVMDSVTISNNTSDEGGAIYAMKSTLTIRKSLINGNNADKGGAIWSYGGHIYIVSSTIAGNTAGMGSGIFSLSDTLVMANSILWNTSGDELHTRLDMDTTYFFSAYSNIRGMETNFANIQMINRNWLDGNTDFDPEFIDAGNNIFELDASSPLINKGTSFFVFDTLVLIDYATGEYSGTAPDMGAYEYIGTVSVPDKYLSETKVYPNPFSGFITVVSEKEITRLELYDLTGRRVFVAENTNTARIGDLQKGAYFLLVYSDEGLINSEKVIRQ